MQTIERVAVVGATGYSGEELIRILLRHPQVELTAVTSRTNDGKSIASVFPRFRGIKGADLQFTGSSVEQVADSGASTVFLALPHGAAAEFAQPMLKAGLRVIDLSADFRLRDADVYEDFYGDKHPAPELLAEAVYGMPEIHRERIRNSRLVASAGCYPTSVILPLVPLLRNGLIDPTSIAVMSMSGVSGAGRKAEVGYLFAECNESVRSYGVPRHRHLSEIEQELSAAGGERVLINFTPHLIPVTRGIHTTIYAMPKGDLEARHLDEVFEEAYAAEPFVRLLGSAGYPDTKHITGTNFIDIAWRLDPRTRRIVLLSAVDNLVKGAAGQAVQCLNICCGFPEEMGL